MGKSRRGKFSNRLDIVALKPRGHYWVRGKIKPGRKKRKKKSSSKKKKKTRRKKSGKRIGGVLGKIFR